MMEAMGMIRCEDALARLWEFLDDELSPDEEIQVKEHLDICNRCYPQYDFQRAYFAYTRRIRDRDHASPELRRRIFRMILEEEAGSNGNE
ncbi:MAG TPA: zf-HC2 domain-containing protein [Longimicrobiales bacterium]|nr:zf-HC2 domain-containing protein [Longimicrobiales bacterium]